MLGSEDDITITVTVREARALSRMADLLGEYLVPHVEVPGCPPALPSASMKIQLAMFEYGLTE